MSTNDNGRAEARTRANRRLRRMTIGTTMLGLAATGTLGWLAGRHRQRDDGDRGRDGDRDGFHVRVDRIPPPPPRRSTTPPRPPHGDHDHGHRPCIERRLVT